MKKVQHLLEKKGPEIWSIEPDSSVFAALELMAAKDVGALLVMAGDEIRGIFSERDYARKIILVGKRSAETKVREIMSSPVSCIEPEASVDDVMQLMTAQRIRHLPVVKDRKVLGVISIGDVVKATMSEKEFHIQQLEHYITGG